jgi:hypothetical protein
MVFAGSGKEREIGCSCGRNPYDAFSAPPPFVFIHFGRRRGKIRTIR